MAACKPTVGQPPSLVSEPVLLAVVGEPPEAKPGASVTYSFLLASASGTVTTADALWDTCLTPKPPSESNSVASACTGAPDAGVASMGQSYTAAVPSNACQLFGPIAPPPAAGQPAVRPRDPDGTGGYYLPVQVWLPSVAASPVSGFAMERITCNLANAPSAIIAAYASTYTPNRDPGIDHADIVDGAGQRTSLDQGQVQLPPNVLISIEAVIADGASESFPVYDAESEALVQKREALRLSWFASGGSFTYDHTDISDGASTNSNPWVTPAASGTYSIWLVLRDSRGGTAVKSYQVAVGN